MFLRHAARPFWTALIICVGLTVFPVAATSAPLTRGHALLLEQGLNINAYTFAHFNGFNAALWAQSNFTGQMILGVEEYQPWLYGAPGQSNWNVMTSRQASVVQSASLPYIPSLKTWAYMDEQDISDPAILQETADFFATMRADPRLNHVVFYANQFGLQFTEDQLRNYVKVAKPDMLMFDYYVFGAQYPWFHSGGSPTGVYRMLSTYRKLGLAGHDGTGREPIPFGHWIQSFNMKLDYGPQSQAYGYRMSESELRLDQFAGWAFGAKLATAFLYDDPRDFMATTFLLDGPGPDAKPTKSFYEMAKANRESRNLGPALIALHSTDVRMVKGPSTWKDNYVDEFDATSDPFLKQITPTNLGTTNEGKPGDVVAGWFRPLLEDLGKPVSADQTYFMIVNGLSWKDASAADTAQLIRLDFDFGDSGITSLQRLSRETGEVEFVSLVSDGGSRYHLDLVLPGGTGDLFKYNTGGAFVSAPEPGIAMAFAGLLVPLMGRRRGRRAA